MGKQPHGRDHKTPCPDLNLEGMPTLAQSRRGKGTVLTGWVLPQPPGRVKNLRILPLGFPR